MLPDLSTSACAWCWSADGSNRRFPETLRRTLPRFPASWPWRGRGSGEPSFSVLAGKCKVGFKNFRFCLKKKCGGAFHGFGGIRRTLDFLKMNVLWGREGEKKERGREVGIRWEERGRDEKERRAEMGWPAVLCQNEKRLHLCKCLL